MYMMTSLILPPLCSTEVLSPSEHAAQLQRSEILEECEQGRNRCYTLKSVEKVMKKVRTFNANRAYSIFGHFQLRLLTQKEKDWGSVLCGVKSTHIHTVHIHTSIHKAQLRS